MTMVDNMVNVVKTLLKAYPESAFIADKDGNRPKDLARLHKADERILLLLSREENRCELDNDYQKHFASVADTTVLRGNASTIPTTLPYSRARDDVSSIGSSALSYCEPKDEEEEEGESSSTTAKDMLKKSPFQKMTNIDEVIRFVEKNMFRPPLGLEEFDLFDKKNIE